MKIDELVGKEILGFIFEGGPGFVPSMETKIGVVGKINTIYNNSVCSVIFKDGSGWCYTYPEILEHLVEPHKEKETYEIISDIEILLKQIKK